MPEYERRHASTGTSDISGAEPPAALVDLAPLQLADSGAVMGEDVAPVAADTMGNAATGMMVQEWVQGMHGGATDDALLRGERRPWETEHRFEVRQDISESARLSRRKSRDLDGDRTLETGGSTTGSFSSRDGVRTGSLGGKGDFTVRGTEALDHGERSTSTTGRGGLELQRSARKDADGTPHVRRSTSGDLALGRDVVTGQQLEDGTVVESRAAGEGGFGWSRTHDDGTLKDQTLRGNAAGEWGRTRTAVDDAGTERTRTVGLSARGQGQRQGLGDAARHSGTAELGLTGGLTTVQSADGRTVTTDLSGEVGLDGGGSHGPKGEGRGLTDAGGNLRTGGAWRRTVETRGDDGGRSKTSLGVQGGAHGGVAGLGDDQRIQGGGELALDGSHSVQRKTDDGRTIRDDFSGSVKSSVDGDGARHERADGGLQTRHQASLSAGRRVSRTDDAGVTHGRFVSASTEGSTQTERQRKESGGFGLATDSRTSRAKGSLTAGGDRSWKEGEVARRQSAEATLSGDVSRSRRGEADPTGSRSAALGGKLSDSRVWTDDDGTRHDVVRSADGRVSTERKGEDRTHRGEVGVGRTTKTESAVDGGTLAVEDKDRISLSGSRARSGDAAATHAVELGGSRKHSERLETTDDAGRHSLTSERNIAGGGTWDSKRGFGLSASHGTSQETRTVTADGRTIRGSQDTDSRAALSRKGGLELSHSTRGIDREEVEKLDEHTTLTTREGETQARSSAGVTRDDGTWRGTASASASTVAYGQTVKWADGSGWDASAGYRVAAAEADANATAELTQDQLKVTGNAGAKATLVDGNVRIEVPAFDWNLLGEDVQVKLTAGVDAAVAAEAKGNIELNLQKGEELSMAMSGGGRAFAGATAGVEVGGRVDWKRKPDYTDLLIDFMDDVPGIGWALDDIPRDIYQQAALALVGSGTSQLVAARAGLMGSAGLGGEASFAGGLEGGRIRLSGKLHGAFGIGGGLKTSVDLDAVDGVRFAGVVGLRGIEWIKKEIGGVDEWMDQAIDDIQERIDAYLEAEKAEGGFDGWVAGAVDWLGDDLLDLW
ncbi:MAG: hypothetical protein H6742_16245 [Alphaproteobacteria bacterium]|nr:hypothetical protein [Alphaproteobacteria bacterium]